MYYIYIHRRADDGKVFYVGKGKGRRIYARDGRNTYWHRVANKHGIKHELVAPWRSEAEAFEHEKFLISCFRDLGHPLVNLTDGGDGASGCPASEEKKKKISIKNTGKKRTPEQNRANAEQRKGRKQNTETIEKRAAALRGQKRSAAACASISAGRMGIKPTQESIGKTRAKTKGRPRSPEFKAKVSAGNMGRIVSQSTREKLSAAHKGRVISTEMRERISQTLTGRRLSEEQKERRHPLTHSSETCAKRSATMKGRPWSEVRRAAQKRRIKDANP